MATFVQAAFYKNPITQTPVLSLFPCEKSLNVFQVISPNSIVTFAS